MRSGHNELRNEELVTWKVAGELMTLSISHIQKKGDNTQTHTHTRSHTNSPRCAYKTLVTHAGWLELLLVAPPKSVCLENADAKCCFTLTTRQQLVDQALYLQERDIG